ncbi:MAG: thiolase family protein [Chloroflexi bacterium]|nr:thiolase family protein [Chloroflexota bacterium]
MYRTREGLGIWEHRGKVVAVGIGHSPTARRWDEQVGTSLGAWSIIALRNAMQDAGVSPDQVDGLVLPPAATTGDLWSFTRPIPEDFARTYQLTNNPDDGISSMSADWILKNMPELKNVKFTMHAGGCMSQAIVVAAQAVGSGLTHTCLVLKGWNNLSGRYGHGRETNVSDTAPGDLQWTKPWGWGAAAIQYAYLFDQYCRRYGKNHDMMAPFVVNEKRNGLMFPEGFFYQHRPEVLTVEDYLAARWVAKPANLYDCDLPIQTAAAYLFTTPERARDMKQRPVYILNHASDRSKERSVLQTLDECEQGTDSTGRKLYEGAGITASDLSFENMYDGYTLFHQFHIEGLRYAGIKRGEALDLYQTDISIEGPNPVSPSGGNQGGGRTRFWMHTDCIQQIQGRAGQRQISKKAEIGVSGGPTTSGGNFTVWSASPD